MSRTHQVTRSRLTVGVADGEVTLEGRVRDLETRRIVDDIASRCVGVQQVHNQLRIERVNDNSPPRTNGTKRQSR